MDTRKRDEDWAAYADALELRLDVAALWREVREVRLALAQRRIAALEHELKYRPDQPRVPAGYREGGQWTIDGAGTPSAHPGRGGAGHVGGGGHQAQVAQGSIGADAAALLGLGQAEAQIPRGSNLPPTETTMRDMFPGLQNAPGSAILAPADALLGLTAPGDAANLAAVQQQFQSLDAQIKAIDPRYHYDALWPPGGLAAMTWAHRAAVLDDLRFDLAATKYKVLGHIEALQVETLRFTQARVDEAYARAKKDWEEGELTPRLSREEAIGNKVDRDVRRDVIIRLNRAGIDPKRDPSVRVNMRVYHQTESSYRIPDARVGDATFDWTIARKTDKTPQIQGYFGSQASPRSVIIVRPSQIGGTYAIRPPAERKSMPRFYRINVPVYIPDNFPDLIDFLSVIMSRAPAFDDVDLVDGSAETLRSQFFESLGKLASLLTPAEDAEIRSLFDQAFAHFAKTSERYSEEGRAGLKLLSRVEEILDAAWGRAEESGLGNGSRE